MYSIGEGFEMELDAARRAVKGDAATPSRKLLTTDEMKTELLLRRGYVATAEAMLAQIDEMRRLDTTQADAVGMESGLTCGAVRCGAGRLAAFGAVLRHPPRDRTAGIGGDGPVAEPWREPGAEGKRCDVSEYTIRRLKWIKCADGL